MHDLTLFIRQALPVRMEATWGTITGGAGALGTLAFGPWNDALQCLVAAMVIDYITGMAAAFINPNLALNSQRGFRGIAKKVLMLAVISFAHYIDVALGQRILCAAVTWFYIGNEGLSIIENAAKAGLPIPNKLKNTLEQLSNEKSAREEGVKK